MPLRRCAAYERMNNNIRGCFARVGWKLLLEAAAECGEAAEHAKCTRLLASAQLPRLALSFRKCAAFTDEAAHILARTLPNSLEEVRLEFVTSSATTDGGNAVFHGVFARIDLHGLRVIEMNDCLLSCEIPEAICSCSSLVSLTLAGNRMHGPIPPSLGKCRCLKELRCQNNHFTGAVPAELGHCPLTLVRLNGNALTGLLPPELGSCVHLTELRIHNNQLSGPVPAALNACLMLRNLNVDAPMLDGLPEALRRRQQSGALLVNHARR